MDILLHKVRNIRIDIPFSQAFKFGNKVISETATVAAFSTLINAKLLLWQISKAPEAMKQLRFFEED